MYLYNYTKIQLDLANNLQSEIIQLYTNGTLQTKDPRLDR